MAVQAPTKVVRDYLNDSRPWLEFLAQGGFVEGDIVVSGVRRMPFNLLCRIDQSIDDLSSMNRVAWWVGSIRLIPIEPAGGNSLTECPPNTLPPIPPTDRRRVQGGHHLDVREHDMWWHRTASDLIDVWMKRGAQQLNNSARLLTHTYHAHPTHSQNIIQQILNNGQDTEGASLSKTSPWLDSSWGDHAGMLATLKEQREAGKRRVIKSHLPAEALPLDPNARYIFVARCGSLLDDFQIDRSCIHQSNHRPSFHSNRPQSNQPTPNPTPSHRNGKRLRPELP